MLTIQIHRDNNPITIIITNQPQIEMSEVLNVAGYQTTKAHAVPRESIKDDLRLAVGTSQRYVPIPKLPTLFRSLLLFDVVEDASEVFGLVCVTTL